jgi:hypothetical protein
MALAPGHQRLPTAFKPFIIDCRVDAFCERDFVLLPRLHDRRADGSLMHDEQPMLVQPASGEDQ